jgi:hypothetical protein
VPVQPLDTIPGPLRLATVHDYSYTCPTRAMIQMEDFCALTANCELINNKNSAVAIKLETVLNVLRQL